jgi:alkylated DNA repair dioxygenase AlkB
MYLKCQYIRNELDVDFYPNLLTPELAHGWYQYLEAILPHANRRNTTLFGDDGIIYKVRYQNIDTEKHVLPWNHLPALPELKTLVERLTDQQYTVCAIQRYPNGNIGINPHRDREMILGTRIAGLSLGATRTLSFTHNYFDPVNIRLPSGSLYVMNPPTNQKWLHSIVKDPSVTQPRFSLTFRDYRS